MVEVPKNLTLNFKCLPARRPGFMVRSARPSIVALSRHTIVCAVGGLTDFAFAYLLQKQIELNVG